MHQLENVIFNVAIDPQNGQFHIQPRDLKYISLHGIRLGCSYSINGKPFEAIEGEWLGNPPELKTIESTEHGIIETLVFQVSRDIHGIRTRLTIGILQEYPLVAWKLEVTNTGGDAVNIERIDLLQLDPSESGKIMYPSSAARSDLGFFSNGWQSWSPARWYSAESQMKISHLGFLQHPMIYNPGTPLPHQPERFSSDMFAVIGDRKAHTGFLVGFLSQKKHFGSIYADFQTGSLAMWANGDHTRLQPGHSMETDWAVFNPILLDHRDPLNKYLEAVSRENHVRLPEDTPVGWCSWYHFYTSVTARDVEDNLNAILDQQDHLPIQLVQIDDGFESQVGDWFKFKSTFPEGVVPLAKKITQQGLVPGLWLAPFIVHRKSYLYKKHPDWILRGSNGQPVNAGFVWNSLGTSLDLTVPGALDYACSVVRTASKEWGFPYLKLDFLYAAALNGCYQDPDLTRAQVLRRGMEAIREAAGQDVTLLGCGAPLGSMLGLVDIMRIGPDVSGNWHPTYMGIQVFFKNEPGFPSARNSIYNIISRATFHRRWWVNDPDCLLIRPDTSLTLDEIRTLAAAIAMTGGSLLLSDNLPKLPRERLTIAEVLLPVINERIRVIDWFDSSLPSRFRLDLVNSTGEWHVLTAFNWKDEAADLNISLKDFDLPAGDYFTREFWTGSLGELSVNHSLTFPAVPGHGSILLGVRRKETGPVYLGSTLHFSQGIEVAEWKIADSILNVTLRLPRRTNGEVFFYIPNPVKDVLVNGEHQEIKELGGGFYSLSVVMDGFAHLEING